MTKSFETGKEEFPFMEAAFKAGETVRRGNGLQEDALSQIMGSAFQAEVARAFPTEEARPTSE